MGRYRYRLVEGFKLDLKGEGQEVNGDVLRRLLAKEDVVVREDECHLHLVEDKDMPQQGSLQFS